MSDHIEYTLDPQQWVERYGDYLFNYAASRVSDREKAEDLVQETFLAALRARDHYRGESTERTWLTSILKRKIIDTYRKKYSSRESAFGDTEGAAFDGDYYRGEDPFGGHWQEGKEPHSQSLLPEGKLEEEELKGFILDCIEHLKPNLAAVFIMKMIDEEDSSYICKELGITPSNLWVMLHRARLRMRDCLEKKWLK